MGEKQGVLSQVCSMFHDNQAVRQFRREDMKSLVKAVNIKHPENNACVFSRITPSSVNCLI